VFGVDTNLIEDGTYFVAEIDGQVSGCGGWSKRRISTVVISIRKRAGYLDPESEPARIRAFFIHPAHARKGIARAILLACENEAREHGVSRTRVDGDASRYRVLQVLRLLRKSATLFWI
jgi:GNAT superfamily N-acetyltransferase